MRRAGAAISRGKLVARCHRAPRKGNRRGVPVPEPSSVPAPARRRPRRPAPRTLASGAPVPSLRPAPPRPFHCQPGAAGAQPGHPGRPPNGPAGLPRPPAQPPVPVPVPLVGWAPLSSLFAPNSASLGARHFLRFQPRPGPTAGLRIPPPPSLFAQDAPAPHRPQEFYRFFSNPPLFPEEASWAA